METAGEDDDVIIVNDVSMVDLESEESQDIQKKCDALMSILVDVDPVYAREMSSEYAFRQDDFEQFVAQLVESGCYPKLQAHSSKGEAPPPPKKEFSIEDFLDKYPQPLDYFKSRDRLKANDAYVSLTLEYLKDRFKFCSLPDIRKALTVSEHSLTKAVKYLEGKPQTRKKKRARYEINTIHTFNQDFQDEMYFLDHEQEINEYIENQLLLKASRVEEARARGELLECGCCFGDDLLPEEMVPCEAGHLFCRSCLKSHANILIGEQKVRFPCLQDCPSQFNYESIKLVVKKPVYEKLLKRLQEHEVKSAGIEGLEFCPFCEYAEIPPEGDKIFKCKNCLKESCRLCHKVSHIPLKCDEADDNRLTKVRTQMEERITECLVRTCPKCQRKFIKEDGCNKMTCSCGAIMCYLCRQPVKGYNHFNQRGTEAEKKKCPLYSNNDELHFDVIEKEAEKLKAEALAKEPALVDKFDPLKGLRPSTLQSLPPRGPPLIPRLQVGHRPRGGIHRPRGGIHRVRPFNGGLNFRDNFMLQIYYNQFQP